MSALREIWKREGVPDDTSPPSSFVRMEKKLICGACGKLFSARALPEHISAHHLPYRCLQIARCISEKCLKHRSVYSLPYMTDHFLPKSNESKIDHLMIFPKQACTHRLQCQKVFDDIMACSIGMGFVDKNYQRVDNRHLDSLRRFFRENKDRVVPNQPIRRGDGILKACFQQEYDDEQDRRNENGGGFPQLNNGNTTPAHDGRSPGYDYRSPGSTPGASPGHSSGDATPRDDCFDNGRNGSKSPGYEDDGAVHRPFSHEEPPPVPPKVSQPTTVHSLLKVKQEVHEERPIEQRPTTSASVQRPFTDNRPSSSSNNPSSRKRSSADSSVDASNGYHEARLPSSSIDPTNNLNSVPLPPQMPVHTPHTSSFAAAAQSTQYQQPYNHSHHQPYPYPHPYAGNSAYQMPAQYSMNNGYSVNNGPPTNNFAAKSVHHTPPNRWNGPPMNVPFNRNENVNQSNRFNRHSSHQFNHSNGNNYQHPTIPSNNSRYGSSSHNQQQQPKIPFNPSIFPPDESERTKKDQKKRRWD